MKVRAAEHAGSWYSSNKLQLNTQLDTFLNNVAIKEEEEENGNEQQQQQQKRVKGIIGPHAGYRYCGQTSAYAYKNVVIGNTDSVRTIFVLGPSHHLYMSNECGLSQAHLVQTPLGNLKVNRALTDELLSKHGHLFNIVKNMSDEEDEHSLEMHFPFIAKTFDVNRVDIVPVIVGHLNSQAALELGRVFSSYLEDPQYFFVISSDFCHWGKRFGYTHYDESKGPIWQSIKDLDLMGAAYICNLDATGFESYLKKYKNTICGRYAILILLRALLDKTNGGNGSGNGGGTGSFEIKLTHYSQSSKVTDFHDSSVSYASFCLFQSDVVDTIAAE